MQTNSKSKNLFETNEVRAFSIIIPSWNNLAYLQLCIDSIRKNSAYEHQVIVHINEGSDGTLEWVKSQEDIQFTYSTMNVGVCYALNGCRPLVASNYMVYVNDDMYLLPGWDLALMAEISNIGHTNFFLSSTCIEPIASSNCVIEKDYGTNTTNFREKELLDEYKYLDRADWQGSTWPPNIVHRDTWDRVGGYSIEFSPGMYSDPDFSMKLWMAGIRLFKGVSASRAYHFGSKSVKRVVKNKGYYTFISKWGITSSTLTKYYLKRGEDFTGPLSDPPLNAWLRTKNFLKRARSLMMKPEPF